MLMFHDTRILPLYQHFFCFLSAHERNLFSKFRESRMCVTEGSRQLSGEGGIHAKWWSEVSDYKNQETFGWVQD